MVPPRRSLTRVAEGVLVATSTMDATTSTVILGWSRGCADPAPDSRATGVPALVVDPAWLPAELAGLAGELVFRGIRVTAGFSTHAHHDHLLWHPGFGEVARWSSPGTRALSVENREELLGALGADWPTELKPMFAAVTALPGSTVPQPFGPSGPAGTIEVITHDGHAPGHSALWLPDRHVLVAGDMLSDTELPLPFCPDDLPSYLEALEVLAPYVRRAHVLIPGHGTPTTDPLPRLDADRRYLDSVLAGHEPDDPRLGNPGMAENHARILALARRSR